MKEALDTAAARYAELEAKSADPALFADAQAYTVLMKELRSLAPLVTAYRSLQQAQQEADEAKELTASATDEELRAFAAQEHHTCLARIEELTEEIKRLLLPRDPNDERNVIVEIRAGAGGEEAALFAAVLYRMYTMFAERIGYRTVRLSANETDLGGFREISFGVEGEGAYSLLRFESGVHRVQRVPVTESQGRIQTSTVTVAVLPEVDEVEVSINPADIVMESCKSSGAGGQHINKTESAVRLTHKPTGIVVECQEERSQFKNRDKAMKMLRARLYDMELAAQQSAIANERRNQVGTGDRSERIRTYNYPQGRITDHRIGLSMYNIEKVLDGGLDELIAALRNEDAARKMQEKDT